MPRSFVISFARRPEPGTSTVARDDPLWTGAAYREYRLVAGDGTRAGSPNAKRHSRSAMTALANRTDTTTPDRNRDCVHGPASSCSPLSAGSGDVRFPKVSAAEAANLLSLAQLQLEGHPTATVAYAIASLELADSPEMRRLALEALWRGPTELRLPSGSPFCGKFQSRRSLVVDDNAPWWRHALAFRRRIARRHWNSRETFR